MAVVKIFDRANDPAPDVYSVERGENERTFIVRHFPNLEATKACCAAKVTIKPEDHKHEHGPEIAALMRADRMIQQKHEREGK